jgi:UDP:flavonoid glycosyltransferase YjiC (YdhE family)
MAVAPNMVSFVESAGLSAVPYGPDSQVQISAASDFLRNLMQIRRPSNIVRAVKDIYALGWAEMSRTLTLLADGVDLLFTGHTYQGVAVNVAEYYDIPLAALHYFPVRVNGYLAMPGLPLSPPLIRSGMRAAWWLYWQITKDAEDAQRRELGLPRAASSAAQRIVERGYLEIQAYDQVCFPGLAAEWSGRRPFVGGLTMELATDADDEVTSWIAGGTPPIYFSFGSTPVLSPADTVTMISEACAELGERALIYCGTSESNRIPHPEYVKLVGPVNYAAIFPACRAVVHHGGAGTTAAGLRAGIPTLILWDVADQPIWAAQVKRLKVGSARRFSGTTRESLVADLRSILEPQYATRAREIATGMSQPAAAVATAADLLENAARGSEACPERLSPPISQ